MATAETKPPVDRERVRQIMNLGREVYLKNPAKHWEIRNQLETLDRLLGSKSLSALFGRGDPAKNAEAGLRNATIRLLTLIADSPVE